jgi:formate hydrogenlyase subunit 3/multisubunit Na+/H+ antiporter MnhD subunit
MNKGLVWGWIVQAALIPPPIAFPMAWLLWRYASTMIGNVVGCALLFGTTVAAIGREYFALQALTRTCIAQEIPCPIKPDAFTRFAIYAFIGMFQIAALYTIGLWREERARRGSFSPEWRR